LYLLHITEPERLRHPRAWAFTHHRRRCCDS